MDHREHLGHVLSTRFVTSLYLCVRGVHFCPAISFYTAISTRFMSSKGAYRVQSPRKANRPQSPPSVCPEQAAISTICLSSTRPTGHNLSVQHRPQSPTSVCPAQATISNICLSSTGRNLRHLSVQHRPKSPTSVCPAQATISNICLSSTGPNLQHLSVQQRPQFPPAVCPAGPRKGPLILSLANTAKTLAPPSSAPNTKPHSKEGEGKQSI